MPKKKPLDERNFVQGLADGLRFAARNPNIERYNPHFKQKRFHTSEKPGRLFLGGNRSGKTVGGATETIFYASGNHPFKKIPFEPPIRCRVVTVDFNQGLQQIILPELKKWIPPSLLINGSWEDSYSKSSRVLTLANKSFIEFLTYEQELQKFAGTSRHITWFDEEPPKDIFTECMLRLVDTEGHWWMTMTPVEGMTWTFDDIYEANSPYNDIIEVDMDENPHLTEYGKSVALHGLTEEEIKARKHGQYISLGGLIYYGNAFQEDVSTINPLIPPADWLWIAGMDHGFTNATCFLWAACDENNRVIIFDEYYQSNRIVQENARAVHAKNLEHGRPPDSYVGDPSIKNVDPIVGTSVHIEYMDNGIPIVLGNNDVHAGIDRVKKYMIGDGPEKPKLYITSNCEKLLWELKRYRWGTYKGRIKEEKNKKEDPVKKDDHACDALRYLIASRPELDVPAPVGKGTDPHGVPRAMEPNKGLRDPDSSRPTKQEYDPDLGAEY